jgi:hypothetical protein
MSTYTARKAAAASGMARINRCRDPDLPRMAVLELKINPSGHGLDGFDPRRPGGWR